MAQKTVKCNKNYFDLNEKDCARELAELATAFELFPIHSASLKVISSNSDFGKNKRGLICVFQ